MKFGVCSNLSGAAASKNFGFDYLEFNLTALAKMSEEEFESFRNDAKHGPLPIESFNGFCPSDIRLTVNVDAERLKDYAERALSRASLIGAEIAVVGSSASRSLPEGYSFEKGCDEFCRSITIISQIAEKYSMKIAIEPLCAAETNFINTLAQAHEIASRVGRANVGYIVDLYHFYKNGEELSDIERYGEGILHTHIARRNADRRIPMEGDEKDVVDFCGSLDRIGYKGRMSLEGSFYPSFDKAVKGFSELLKNTKIR